MCDKRSRLQLPPREYHDLCDQVHERDKWRCTVCARRNDLHSHHVIFRSRTERFETPRGVVELHGDDASWNLITVCKACHDAIHHNDVIILPLIDGQWVDCNKGVRLMFVNGWTPKHSRRR